MNGGTRVGTSQFKVASPGLSSVLIVTCVNLNDSKQDVGREGRSFEVVPHFAPFLFPFGARNETMSC